MTIGSPGIFQRPTRTFNPSFFKACSRHAAQRFSFSLNKGFSFPAQKSGPIEKDFVFELLPAVFWPWWNNIRINSPYFITYLPNLLRIYNQGLTILLPSIN